MPLKKWGMIAALTLISACRTTGSSGTAAFNINGDLAAAHQLIINSIVKTYPKVATSQAVLDRFATALQNGNTVQAASSDYVLQLAYTKLSSSDTSQPTEFDSYVAIEFVALTNYTTVLQAPGTALVYTGTTASPTLGQ